MAKNHKLPRTSFAQHSNKHFPILVQYKDPIFKNYWSKQSNNNNKCLQNQWVRSYLVCASEYSAFPTWNQIGDVKTQKKTEGSGIRLTAVLWSILRWWRLSHTPVETDLWLRIGWKVSQIDQTYMVHKPDWARPAYLLFDHVESHLSSGK